MAWPRPVERLRRCGAACTRPIQSLTAAARNLSSCRRVPTTSSAAAPRRSNERLRTHFGDDSGASRSACGRRTTKPSLASVRMLRGSKRTAKTILRTAARNSNTSRTHARCIRSACTSRVVAQQHRSARPGAFAQAQTLVDWSEPALVSNIYRRSGGRCVSERPVAAAVHRRSARPCDWRGR